MTAEIAETTVRIAMGETIVKEMEGTIETHGTDETAIEETAIAGMQGTRACADEGHAVEASVLDEAGTCRFSPCLCVP